MTADLHCHTTASDGTLTPTQLVRMAKEKGLKAIGITDHDTVMGIAEATMAGKRFGVEIVPGVELNTDFDGTEVHILGYYPDLNSLVLQDALKNLREARSARVHLIITKLNSLGLNISEERVKEISGEGAIGRPHIAQALEEKGYVTDIKEAFERYIGQGGPAYVSRYKLTPEEGIKLIRQAHGVAVLAHPGLIGRDDVIPSLINSGLLGIEVKHSKHSQEDEQRYSEFAQKYGMLITGGSDYHGPKRELGVELGGCQVEIARVELLKQRKRELG
jgi:3',5'-nucleoside bisphosphate phosphatase